MAHRIIDPGNPKKKPSVVRGKMGPWLKKAFQSKEERKLDIDAHPEEAWSGGEFRWIQFILPVLGLTLVGAAVLYGLFLSPRDERAPRETHVIPKSFLETHSMAESQKSAEDSIRAFMEAETVAEKSRHVVDGANVLAKMERYYQRPGKEAPDGFLKFTGEVFSAAAGSPLFGGIALDKQKRRWIFTLLPGRHRMLIDWESSLGYGEMPWADFVHSRPREPKKMRIYLTRFIDEKTRNMGAEPEYFYRVSPRQGQDIIAVPPRGSNLEKMLPRLVPAQMRQPVTVKLHWTDDTGFAEITELVHDTWIDLKRIESLRSQEH